MEGVFGGGGQVTGKKLEKCVPATGGSDYDKKMMCEMKDKGMNA
jgi:hypothetical protein